MPKEPHIAIIGGGHAGLTAAVILHKHGHSVRVYEIEPSRAHRAQGGTLDLHEDKGQVALRHAGLLDAFRAIARHEDQENKSVDPFTGLLQEGPPRDDEALDRPEIDRGALRDLLLAALPDDVVVWNSRLSCVEVGTDSRHCLVFANGRRVEADIVIGADGAWSCVRHALTQSLPFYTGITFLEGWIEYPTPSQSDLVGRGSLFSFGGPEAIFAQRNGQGRICVYAAVQRDREWLAGQLANLKATFLVQEMYKGWSPNLLNLLDGCETFIERPIYSLPHDFDWIPRSGITLVGDAAHLMPPVGLGVNLAMLDASELALALHQTADWQEAIRQTEVLIGDRARALMQEAIPGFAEWFADNRQ